MTLLRFARRALPVVLLATGACFATRNDVRILQADVLTFRQQAARADSARAREIATLTSLLNVVGDSLKAASATLVRFAGDTRGELRRVGDQVIQMQELVGQSQAVVNRLRAENEERAARQTMPVPPATPPTAPAGDSTTVPPVATPPAPGASLMFQEGLAQFRRGSYGAAQTVFEDLLRLHPTSDVAPDALYYLAESYDAGGTSPRADTTFLAVVAQYPTSPRAPASLYKMALSLARRGSKTEARVAMDRIVKQYPASDVAEFAREWLAANP
jgi:tol-pal system protein YbgF